MGFWDRFRRKSAAAHGMVLHRQGQAAPTLTNMTALAKEGYGRNPDVFAAVNGITGNAKGIEWRLLKLTRRATRKGWTPQRVQKQLHVAQKLGGARAYRRKRALLVKHHVLEPVEEHALLDVLAQPNPLQDWSQFIESVLGFYCVTGNFFIDMVGPDNPSAPPRELWVLRPDRTRIVIGDAENPVSHYMYGPGQGQRREQEQVIHGKTWNPTDDFWGLSPIMAAARRIDWSNAAEDWNLALVQNGGQPAGAVMVEGNLNPDQRKEMREWVDTEYTGKDNVGRPLLLEGGMDWKQLALNPQEAAWLEGQEHATRKIAHVLRWPSVLLGDSSDRTYSNYGEARKASYEEATLPLLDLVRNLLNTRLVPRFGDDLILDYCIEDIEALQDDKTEAWKRIDESEELTFNEKRIAKGYESLPGLDVVLVPATKIPVGGTPPAKDGTKAGLEPAELRSIGFRTLDQKEAWWQVLEAERERIEERMTQLMQDVLDGELAVAMAAVRGASHEVSAGIAAERALEAYRPTWEQTIKQLYLSTAGVFATHVADSLTKDAGGLPYGVTKDDVEDEWQRIVLEYLSTVSATKSALISETSMSAIRAALAAGIAEGESIPQLANRISDVYDAGSSYRATMIARTEVVAASNLGNRAGAKATGLPLTKEWLASPGGRTRDTHAAAGSTYSADPIGLDDPFVVGGAQLMFPGDSSMGAPASEVVNCRCTEVYNVVE